MKFAEPKLNPRIAFAHRDFRFFQLARLLSILGWQMQSVAVGWQVYDITHKPLYLGLIGLAQFLPNAAFSLLTGHIADRFDRRRVVLVCQSVLILCSLMLVGLTHHGIHQIGWIYVLLFFIGTAQAFQSPASQALLPLIIPAEHFSNAVAWNSSIWQFATILGPSLGGILYGLSGGASAVYLIDAVLTFGALLSIVALRTRSGRMEARTVSWQTVSAGVRYVFAKKIILGCISLDLFAVLLGGAVALLPVYARDILHIGPTGLGVLRGAPAVGALVTAVAMAHLPPLKRSGATMLWCVAGFGLATIIFGVSKNFALSLTCLVLLGSFDMVSVIVRHTLVQVMTPKSMLGRVNAVNFVFIGASNELGEFESGVTAAWWGTVPAVVIGGVGTLVVVGLWALMFPGMRKFGRLDQARPEEEPDEAVEKI